MARNEENPPRPRKVSCANCGRSIYLSEACSYGEYDKKQKVEYFCNANCALAKLFGIIQDRELILGLENAK